MYRTAVISDEISQDLTVACQLANQYKLDGLEIRSVEEKNPFAMTGEDVKRIRDITTAHGLKICSVAPPFFKCDMDDPAAIKAHLEGLRRCGEAAHVWGTDLVRGFTFWRLPNPKERLEAIAEQYAAVIRIAEEEGIRIAIESEPSVNTENMQLLYDFLKLLDSPRVGALFDAGNEASDIHCPPAYPVGYELLKPYLFHVHVKDTKTSPEGKEFYTPALMGEGDVDYHGLIQRLKKDGYDGWVSIETHYRMHKASFEDGELALPQGGSFSQGGYEATEAYLKILKDQYRWQEALS